MAGHGIAGYDPIRRHIDRICRQLALGFAINEGLSGNLKDAIDRHAFADQQNAVILIDRHVYSM